MYYKLRWSHQAECQGALLCKCKGWLRYYIRRELDDIYIDVVNEDQAHEADDDAEPQEVFRRFYNPDQLENVVQTFLDDIGDDINSSDDDELFEETHQNFQTNFLLCNKKNVTRLVI